MTNSGKPQSMPIDPSARMIFEVLEQVGWSVENATQITERIRQLELGMPAEDEFALLISWMGKCELVHKLDQEQSPPESRNDYRVPDLLAVFRYENSAIPVLIEVKVSKGKKLSWKPSYLDSLKLYAAKLNLPLLVAWKWAELGLWTLFEVKHFTKAGQNYTVTAELALKETLMCLLAGDFGVEFCKGVGFHLVFRKQEERESPNGPSTKTVLARVEDTFFTDSRGAKIGSLVPGLWALFLCAHHEERLTGNDSLFTQSFVIEDEAIEFAHRMLPILLQFKVGKDKTLRWRQIRSTYSVPIQIETLRKGANDDASANIVRSVISIEPNTRPEFLSSL